MLAVDNLKRMNILIVHNYYQIPGGEDTVVANEKKMLEANGHKVILYSRNNKELKEMSKIKKIFLPLITIFNPRTYIEIRKLIKKENIEIVHVHNTLNLISPSVYYAALSCKVPVVQTVHNFRLLCPGATFYRDGHICEECVQHGLKCAVRYNCYRGSKIQTIACVVNTQIHRMMKIYGKIYYICLTEFNKNKLLELEQIKEKHVYIKPNFVNDQIEFIPESRRDNFYIFAGRIDELKGIRMLLKAWEKMDKNAFKLIICGNGPLKKEGEKITREKNLNVVWKGFLSNKEICSLLSKSKALILPTQWYEGFPMSIVEAYSVGTPVICSDIGNAGSIVEEGITGCKFNAKSETELIAAIKRSSGLCESTYDIYKKKYTEEINYNLLIEIYMKVMKK